MNKLWAPWRTPYITKIGKKKKGCAFCSILQKRSDAKNYIFVRFLHSFAVLNIYPYNNGHILILPYRHVGELEKLTKPEREDVMNLLLYCRKLCDEVLSPDGYNIGMNVGRVAGAGVPGHVHFHLVPRWNGDVNFMPIMTDTKVISQSLRELHRKLSQAHKKRKK